MLLFRQMIRKCRGPKSGLQNRPEAISGLHTPRNHSAMLAFDFYLGEFDAQTIDRPGDAVVPEPDQLRLQRDPDQ
jgi:hypothetical protein